MILVKAKHHQKRLIHWLELTLANIVITSMIKSNLVNGKREEQLTTAPTHLMVEYNV